MTNLALKSIPPFAAPQASLMILNGSDKGTSYQLLATSISLGRDAENDIALKDPRTSRRHAVIELQKDQHIIKDLGSQNGIKLNGRVCREAVLKAGDVVTVGDTEIKYQSLDQAPQFNLVQTPTNTNATPAFAPPQQPIDSKDPQKKGSLSPRQRFYLIIGVVGLILYFLISSNPVKKKDEGLRGEQAIQAEIETIKDEKELLEREKFNSGENTRQYIEAQSAYIKGFRDFREGNYGRAMQSFNAALALYPNHTLAQKYLRLSERKLDELVQYNMYQGRRYMEQNRYDFAQSSFRKVMVLLADPNNKTFQEASERLKEINLITQGRY